MQFDTISKAIDVTLPEDLKYACLYSIEHIFRFDGTESDMLQSLDIFLFKHLLHWFKAMRSHKRYYRVTSKTGFLALRRSILFTSDMDIVRETLDC